MLLLLPLLLLLLLLVLVHARARARARAPARAPAPAPAPLADTDPLRAGRLASALGLDDLEEAAIAYEAFSHPPLRNFGGRKQVAQALAAYKLVQPKETTMPDSATLPKPLLLRCPGPA